MKLKALWELIDLVVNEVGLDDTCKDEPDESSVSYGPGYTPEGAASMTFGHVRRARQELMFLLGVFEAMDENGSMDASRIGKAVKEIERLKKAVGWFEYYKSQLNNPAVMHDDHVGISMNHSADLTGADEAIDVLTGVVNFKLPGLIEEALENCKTLIETHRYVIREETSKI